MTCSTGKRLYWCDTNNNAIESATLDGNDQKIMLTSTGNFCLGSAFMAPTLYYTDVAGRYDILTYIFMIIYIYIRSY